MAKELDEVVEQFREHPLDSRHPATHRLINPLGGYPLNRPWVGVQLPDQVLRRRTMTADLGNVG